LRRFEFATAARIIFGDGSAGQLASLAGGLGGNALLFTDDQPERVGDLIHSLKGAGLRHTLFPVAGEPSCFRPKTNSAAATIYQTLISSSVTTLLQAAPCRPSS